MKELLKLLPKLPEDVLDIIYDMAKDDGSPVINRLNMLIEYRNNRILYASVLVEIRLLGLLNDAFNDYIATQLIFSDSSDSDETTY